MVRTLTFEKGGRGVHEPPAPMVAPRLQAVICFLPYYSWTGKGVGWGAPSSFLVLIQPLNWQGAGWGRGAPSSLLVLIQPLNWQGCGVGEGCPKLPPCADTAVKLARGQGGGGVPLAPSLC